eukprot:scaffold3.g6500.t1
MLWNACSKSANLDAKAAAAKACRAAMASKGLDETGDSVHAKHAGAAVVGVPWKKSDQKPANSRVHLALADATKHPPKLLTNPYLVTEKRTKNYVYQTLNVSAVLEPYLLVGARGSMLSFEEPGELKVGDEARLTDMYKAHLPAGYAFIRVEMPLAQGGAGGSRSAP